MHADGLDDGVDLLIAATQDILRGNSEMRIGQREIAAKAGVSQALVSHYFRDKTRILIAATRPIVQTYLNEIRQIILSGDNSIEKLENVIELMIRMHRIDGNILESYSACIDNDDQRQRQNMLDEINNELHLLIKECTTQNPIGNAELDFATSILWGTCKSLANCEIRYGNSEEYLISASESDKILARNLSNVMLLGLSACAFERSIISIRR